MAIPKPNQSHIPGSLDVIQRSIFICDGNMIANLLAIDPIRFLTNTFALFWPTPSTSTGRFISSSLMRAGSSEGHAGMKRNPFNAGDDICTISRKYTAHAFFFRICAISLCKAIGREQAFDPSDFADQNSRPPVCHISRRSGCQASKRPPQGSDGNNDKSGS